MASARACPGVSGVDANAHRRNARQSKKRRKRKESKFYHEFKALFIREIKEKYVAKLYRERNCGLSEVVLDDSESKCRIFEHSGGKYSLPEVEIQGKLRRKLGNEITILAKGIRFKKDSGWERTVQTEENEEESDFDSSDEEENSSYEEYIEDEEESDSSSSVIESNIIGQDLACLFLSQLSKGIAKLHLINMLKELASIVGSKLYFYFSGSSNGSDPLAKPFIMNDPGQAKRRRCSSTSSLPYTPSSPEYSPERKRKCKSGYSYDPSESLETRPGLPPNALSHTVCDIIAVVPVEKRTEPHLHTCLVVDVKGLERGTDPAIRSGECFQLYEEAVTYLNHQTIVFGIVMKVGSAKLFSLEKTDSKISVTHINGYQFQDETGSLNAEECMQFVLDTAAVFADFGKSFPKACQICHPPQ